MSKTLTEALSRISRKTRFNQQVTEEPEVTEGVRLNRKHYEKVVEAKVKLATN